MTKKTVEIYIELQAPPEQIVKGIESDENTFSTTSFTTELDFLCLWSIKE